MQLSKYDFPVPCYPQTEKTPIGVSICFSSSIALIFDLNTSFPVLSVLIVMSGTGGSHSISGRSSKAYFSSICY